MFTSGELRDIIKILNHRLTKWDNNKKVVLKWFTICLKWFSAAIEQNALVKASDSSTGPRTGGSKNLFSYLQQSNILLLKDDFFCQFEKSHSRPAIYPSPAWYTLALLYLRRVELERLWSLMHISCKERLVEFSRSLPWVSTYKHASLEQCAPRRLILQVFSLIMTHFCHGVRVLTLRCSWYFSTILHTGIGEIKVVSAV